MFIKSYFFSSNENNLLLLNSFEKMAEQPFIDHKGDISFEDDKKIYITRNYKGNFTTINGTHGKMKKGISKKELVRSIDRLITSDQISHLLVNMNSEQLFKIKNGLVRIKNRIEKAPIKEETVFEKLIGKIQQFVFRFLGYKIGEKSEKEKLERGTYP